MSFAESCRFVFGDSIVCSEPSECECEGGRTAAEPPRMRFSTSTDASVEDEPGPSARARLPLQSQRSQQMRKQVHFSDMSQQSIHPTVLHFNCGGTVVEVTRETLELYPKSLLCELARQCPEGADVFIDRDPYGLRTLVDYLHCGTRILYAECSTTANAEFLEKEAEVGAGRVSHSP